MEQPGIKWAANAAKILCEFIEPDEGEGNIVRVRKIDYASDAERDELESLAPFHPILEYESYQQDALEYLNKMLPNMSDYDKKCAAFGYIFKCVACHRHYPIWWISKKDWQRSFPGFVQTLLDKIGFGIDGEFNGIYLCKDCFEEMQESPKYMTIDQYIADRLVTTRPLTEEGKASMRQLLSQIWDLPAA